MKSLIILLALLSSTTSFAGGVGNGGFVLKCYFLPDGNPKRIDRSEADMDLLAKIENLTIKYTPYDYAEGRKHGHIPNLGPADFNYIKQAEFVLNRFKKVDPTRAARYLIKLQEFEKEIQNLEEDEDFVEVPDLGAAIKPKNCFSKQVMQQRPDGQRFNGNKKYLRDLALWNEFGETTKAGIALHEIIYDEFILNHTYLKNNGRAGLGENSTFVRHFNSLISSDAILEMKPWDYVKLLFRLGLTTADFNGLTVNNGLRLNKMVGSSSFNDITYSLLVITAKSQEEEFDLFRSWGHKPYRLLEEIKPANSLFDTKTFVGIVTPKYIAKLRDDLGFSYQFYDKETNLEGKIISTESIWVSKEGLVKTLRISQTSANAFDYLDAGKNEGILPEIHFDQKTQKPSSITFNAYNGREAKLSKVGIHELKVVEGTIWAPTSSYALVSVRVNYEAKKQCVKLDANFNIKEKTDCKSAGFVTDLTSIEKDLVK